MKLPPCNSHPRSHSRTGHDSAPGSGVIGVKVLIRNSVTPSPETGFWEITPVKSPSRQLDALFRS